MSLICNAQMLYSMEPALDLVKVLGAHSPKEADTPLLAVISCP